MAQGGARPGAGRKKGGKNRLNMEARAEAQKDGGLLPHEFLLKVSRGEPIDGHHPTFQERVEAAKAAAPYFQPKLAQIQQEVKAEFKGVLSEEPMSLEKWAEEYGDSSSEPTN